MHGLARAVAVASLMLLAACAGGERSPVASPAASHQETSWPPPPSDEPNTPAVAALPPERLPTTPPDDARRLVGLSGTTLRNWMGDAVFVRRDGVAEIWRFAAETCFLDVFLYREGSEMRVAHLEARTRVTGQRVTLQACYGRIMAGRPKPVS